MPNRYYKRIDIVNNTFYRAPNYVNLDLSNIRGREIEIREGDRLDIIVQRLYGSDPQNWKALALYNDIGYFFDVKPGKVIRLPYDIQEVLDRI